MFQITNDSENHSKDIKASNIGISLRKKKMEKLLTSNIKIIDNLNCDNNPNEKVTDNIDFDIRTFIINVHNHYQIDINGLLNKDENHTMKLNYCLNSDNFEEFIYSIYTIQQIWLCSDVFFGISDYILDIIFKKLYDFYISNTYLKSILKFILSTMLLIIEQCKAHNNYEHVITKYGYALNYFSSNFKDELLNIYMKMLNSLVKYNLSLSTIIYDSIQDLEIFQNSMTYIKELENISLYNKNNFNDINCEIDFRSTYLKFLLVLLKYKNVSKDIFNKILQHVFYFIGLLSNSYLTSIEDIKICSIFNNNEKNNQFGVQMSNEQYVSIISKDNMSINNIILIDFKTKRDINDLFYSILCLFKLTEVKNQEIYLNKTQNQLIISILITYPYYFHISQILEIYYEHFSNEIYFKQNSKNCELSDLKNHMISLSILNDIILNCFKVLVNMSSFSFKSLKQNFYNGIFDILLDILNDEKILKFSIQVNDQIMIYVLIIMCNNFNDSYEINNLSKNSIFVIYNIYKMITMETKNNNGLAKNENCKNLLKEIYYCIFNYVSSFLGASNLEYIYQNDVIPVNNLVMNYIEYNFNDKSLDELYIKSVKKLLQYEDEFEEEDRLRNFLALCGFKDVIENMSFDSNVIEDFDILLREDITM